MASALTLAACTGPEYDSSRNKRPINSSDDGRSDAAAPDNNAALGSSLRRLTSYEYENSLRDSLNLSARPLDANGRPMYAPITSLPAEIGQNLTTPSMVELRAYLDTADVLATQHLATALKLVPCTPSTDETACAQQLVTALGSSLFRGGLTADLTNDLIQLYQTTRALKDDNGNAVSAQEATRVMISGMLASPNFLYLGFSRTVAGARAPLSPIDLAGRLASFFWASGPDDTARAAAASGGLSDDAAVDKEIDRLIGDSERFGRGIILFARQWLGLDDIDVLTKTNTTWDAQSPAAFRFESEEFVRYVIQKDDAKLSTILTADYSVGIPQNVSFYGNPKTTPLAYYQTYKIPLPSTRRGLLMQPSFLSIHAHTESSSPVKRGQWVLNKLLCNTVPPPPFTINSDPAPRPSGTSTRQQLEAQTSNPQCSGCHKTLNSLGFPFENFDEIGAYRTMDNGVPVDASSALSGTDVDGPVSTPVEFASRLANSAKVRQCFATQLFQFALGRPSVAGDKSSLESVQASFESSKGDIRALFKSIAMSEAFRSHMVE
jgi:Protein of unknown function (DUF1588)/Protein of unknown function (DUF1592)/Protein of unknown function (DUF1585)/Protein of unknown function (DUF1595)